MNAQLHHRATGPRDAAASADRQLLAGPRAAAAARALHAATAHHDPSTGRDAELARIVIEAATLNVDIDRVGEELHVFADRVELIDRTGNTLRRIPRDQLTAVKIRKRLRHATLTIRSPGATITMKGVDPADAEHVRDDLLGLTDPPAKASVALARLDELVDAGLLDRKDLATKRAEVLRGNKPIHRPA